MKGKKIILEGWVVRKHDFKFKRGEYYPPDTCSIVIARGNPNPDNYTESNNWKKVRITIEELPTTKRREGKK